jgi:hypothetical protein
VDGTEGTEGTEGVDGPLLLELLELELLELPPSTTTVVLVPRLPLNHPLIGTTMGDRTLWFDSLPDIKIANAAKQLTRITTNIKRLRSLPFIIKYIHTIIQ